jgi:hypothetical protein
MFAFYSSALLEEVDKLPFEMYIKEITHTGLMTVSFTKELISIPTHILEYAIQTMVYNPKT